MNTNQHIQVAGSRHAADVPAHSFLCAHHLFSGGVCVSVHVWMCLHFAFCFFSLSPEEATVNMNWQ